MTFMRKFADKPTSRRQRYDIAWIGLALLGMAAPLRAQTEITFPSAPRLATTADEWAKNKASPNFDKHRDEAIRKGEARLQKAVELPRGWGNWSFYYACPEDGTSLRAISAQEHQCPRCKKIHKDERTVAAYRTLQHDQANDVALDLAWAYAYSKDDRFAAEVARILLHYADEYASYPDRADRWGRTGFLAFLGGRRYSQSLDEAVGVIKLAKAYDLTRSAPVWTEKRRIHVESDFFRPTADTLLRYNQGINNHQTWYNAGLMAIGSVLADKDLIHKVLHMKGGFHDQLKNSLGDDGFWYEGTMAYHNYALQAMIQIADAGRRLGLPLHHEVRLRKMIDLPLNSTYPNGQFPALNDSDPSHLSSFSAAFLWAWQTYGEKKYALAHANGNLARLQSLLGSDAKLEPFLPTHSSVQKEIGLAILRRGQGDRAVCAMLDFGPHGGSHGHFDKLNIVLYANGREWLLDPGRLTYSHKEYQTWVKHTAAHNTVALGGRSQYPVTGKLIAFEERNDHVFCHARCEGVYPGCIMNRKLLLTETCLVDVFEVEAREETQIDYLLHALSKEVVSDGKQADPNVKALGTRDGYPHLLRGKSWLTQGPSVWRFQANPTLSLGVALEDSRNEEILTCEGIGYSIDQKVPCLVRRVQGRSARFVTLFDLTGNGKTFDRTLLAKIR